MISVKEMWKQVEVKNKAFKRIMPWSCKWMEKVHEAEEWMELLEDTDNQDILPTIERLLDHLNNVLDDPQARADLDSCHSAGYYAHLLIWLLEEVDKRRGWVKRRYIKYVGKGEVDGEKRDEFSPLHRSKLDQSFWMRKGGTEALVDANAVMKRKI